MEQGYKIIPGWTHDMPALICAFTEIPVFFRDRQTGDIEEVKGSIDYYEDRDGEFCVRAEDYERAYNEVYEHDFDNE